MEDWVQVKIIVESSSRPDYGIRISAEGKLLWEGTPGKEATFVLPPDHTVSAVKLVN